jgi:nitrate/TMAO reductase-like tetraheme cytochrome c subunit
MNTKQCKTCREEKPLTEFYKNKAYTGGYRPTCKACHIAHVQANQQKRDKEQHREYMREYMRKYRSKE